MTTLSVLVVDDEAGMRTGVARALRGVTVRVPEVEDAVDFDVAQAASGEEALEAIAHRLPDVLLLDHKLPGLSGLDVLERIGGEDRGVLTIMITAYASLETAIAATKRGAYDFLAKPFTPEELRATLRKASRHLLLARQARRLAEEKRQVRFEFISVLAHELKAPLNAIEGYLNIFRDRSAGEDPGTYEHMLDRCRIRVEGMRKLIFDLLDLTRIESGQKRRDFTELDLRELAAAAAEAFAPQAAERRVTIALAAGGPVRLAGDRGEIEIILNNLLSNAIKYNRDGGRVDLAVAEDGPFATIRVADTGIGMTPQEAARLFQDFVRIRNPKTRDILGSGLGLSTLKKLAQLYGGEVRVDSTPDVGSTFTVLLRKDTSPEVGDAQPQGNAALAAGR